MKNLDYFSEVVALCGHHNVSFVRHCGWNSFLPEKQLSVLVLPPDLPRHRRKNQGIDFLLPNQPVAQCNKTIIPRKGTVLSESFWIHSLIVQGERYFCTCFARLF